MTAEPVERSRKKNDDVQAISNMFSPEAARFLPPLPDKNDQISRSDRVRVPMEATRPPESLYLGRMRAQAGNLSPRSPSPYPVGSTGNAQIFPFGYKEKMTATSTGSDATTIAVNLLG